MVRKLNQNGIQGFHFCTLNLEKSVRRVLERLGWVGEQWEMPNLIISVRVQESFGT